jgi:peptidoglycan hydrolase CwlO-like protein
MNKQPLKALALVAALIGGLTASAVQAAEVNDVLKAGAVKVKTAQVAQTKVDRIADQTDGLLQEFKQVNKQIESLRVYNSQLDRQIVSQKTMMSELQESIKNATVIERGISPLMASMLDGLGDFIELDMPLKQKRVAKRLLI